LDGFSDDSDAINSALSAGGTVVIGTGATALIRKTIKIPSDTTLLCQPGATIDFEPQAPVNIAAGNDRAVAFESGTGEEIPISQPISAGASSFTSSSPPPAMFTGEWLVVLEIDPALQEPEYIDWAQFAGSAGDVVMVQRSFRINFPKNEGHTLSYIPIIDLVHDSQIVGCTIRSRQATVGTPGVSVAYSRNITVRGNSVSMANGQGLYSYRSNRVKFLDNHAAVLGPAAPEFAESTDLEISGNTFGADTGAHEAATTACADLDYGIGYFIFAHNTCSSARNIAVEVLTHAHDGVITDNTMPHADGFGDGFVVIGAENVTIEGNSFTRAPIASGNNGIGVYFEDCYYCTPVIYSRANVVSGNSLDSFSRPLVVSPLDSRLPAEENSLAANGRNAGSADFADTHASTDGALLAPGYSLATSLGVGTLGIPNITNIGRSSFTIEWQTALPLNTQVWFTPSGGAESHYADWALTRKHTAVVNGLDPGTTYSVIVESSDYSSPDLWSRGIYLTTRQ